ncbi:TA system VapC family ribonuclease toxin [Haloferula sp. A504]|jgi:toxin-antitoxin system PIN domain toxin|uniref:TA system VapC family ribonuclease toxin n=1 Tax=Haloferula sp. A504 TaxID=3373601 RepID=UPI0031C0251B|nr:PIN domain-containing protein [Verrucomicrobiaceae bacterium E54]
MAMDLPDNNILINAFRSDSPHHHEAKDWLEDSLNRGLPLRLFPTVEAGFLRVVTHPGIFPVPATIEDARSFLQVVASSPGVETASWTSAARERWVDLCSHLKLRGNDCNDAMLAALAIERGLRLVTFDKGFRRFPDLRLLVLGE